MKAIDYKAFKRQYDAHPRETIQYLTEALKEKQADPYEFSLRELAEVMMGEQIVKSWDPRSGGGTQVLEAEAVDSTAFTNITGQLVISSLLDAYNDEEFLLSRAVRTIPTRLDGEKIPGISKITDDVSTVPEGMPYPTLGMEEDYITTPSTTKKGNIVAVTKEAIFFDRTNLILDRARAIGEKLGLQKEIDIIDCVTGYTNNHSWKGTSYDTYSTNGSASLIGSGSPITGLTNALASNSLEDQTDIDAAEFLFSNILDPATSQPIVITPRHVVVTPKYGLAANRVLNGDEIRVTPASGTVQSVMANPYRGKYELIVSRQFYRRILTKVDTTAAYAQAYWIIGDLAKAFAWMQNWPITVTQEPPNSVAEFERDIVVRFKASHRGVAAVMNPRYALLCYGTRT